MDGSPETHKQQVYFSSSALHFSLLLVCCEIIPLKHKKVTLKFTPSLSVTLSPCLISPSPAFLYPLKSQQPNSLGAVSSPLQSSSASVYFDCKAWFPMLAGRSLALSAEIDQLTTLAEARK